jgi:hypothetical protein
VSAGSSAAHDAANCVHDSSVTSGALTAHQCAQATGASGGIAIAMILVVGFFGFVFLSLIWFMSRPKQQQVVVVEAR